MTPETIIPLAFWLALAAVAFAFAAGWHVIRHAHHLPPRPASNVIRFQDLIRNELDD